MGFSISHKAVSSEKKQNVGNRKENTMGKNTENFSKENAQKKEVGGGNKSDEKKLPPINTDLSIGNIMKGKSGLSAADADKKRKREEIERKRKALAEKNRVIVHL